LGIFGVWIFGLLHGGSSQECGSSPFYLNENNSAEKHGKLQKLVQNKSDHSQILHTSLLGYYELIPKDLHNKLKAWAGNTNVYIQMRFLKYSREVLGILVGN